jgi:hypothetical protein
MDLQDTIKMIADGSVMVVICGIAIYFGIQFLNVGLNFIKTRHLLSPQDKAVKIFYQRQNTDLKIQMVINAALRGTNADRITVIRYHNGVETALLVPMHYMSCCHETHQNGLLPINQKLKQISTSLYPEFLDWLHSQQYRILDRQSSDGEIMRAYNIAGLIDTQKVLFVGLKTLHKKPLGFVSLSRESADITAEDITAVTAAAGQIGAYLEQLEAE